MNTKILNYRKTEHFLYRQWDRGITDEKLIEILQNYPYKKSNTLIVVSRKVLKKLGIKSKQELFLKIDRTWLITCFYGCFQDYIFNCNKKQNYYIMNSFAIIAKNR
jgi:hypothetical protein